MENEKENSDRYNNKNKKIPKNQSKSNFLLFIFNNIIIKLHK